MRKFNLLTFFVLLGTALMAQTILTQDFSSGTFPPSGWTIDAHAGNWSASNSVNAGGTAPEAHMAYSPTFNGISRLISPAINLTGVTALTIKFRQYFDYYADGTTIGVATRVGTGTWHDVWTFSPKDNVGPEIRAISVSNSELGQANVQFCIYFNGNSYNMDNWFIDNIEAFSPYTLDAGVSGLSMPDYMEAGNISVSGSIDNPGITTITAMDVNWQVGAGSVHTTVLTGLHLLRNGSYNFMSTDTWTAVAGSYSMKVWVSNVNGAGPDSNAANDTLVKVFSIASQAVPRTPCFEEFTSSTCAPCATLNGTVLNPFFLSHTGYTLVKYQMSWPAPGDPYYTAEGGVRRFYYGVSFVPMLYVDGNGAANDAANGGLDEMINYFNNVKSISTFMDVSANHTIDATAHTVSVDVTINPYISGNNFTTYVIVFENITTGNHASNGETEFHHVMMKMVPDANGTPVTLVDGTPTVINVTSSLEGTHIEEYSDLRVVVFVQNNATKEIFQSAYSGPPIVDFSIANNATNVSVSTDVYLNFSHSIRNLDNSAITPENLTNIITFTSPDKGAVAFTGTISEDATQIILVPDNDLEDGTVYTITVHDVESSNNLPLTETTLTFTTQVFPSASFNFVNNDTVPVDTIFEINFNVPVRNLNNTAITNTNVINVIDFFDSDNQDVNFTAVVNSQKTRITIKPIANLEYSASYTLIVRDLENSQNILITPDTLKFFTETEIGISDIHNQNFTIFPNPAENQMNIQLSGPVKTAQVTITNIIGEVLYNQPVLENTLSIDCSAFNQGVYFVTLTNGKQKITKKVTLVR